MSQIHATSSRSLFRMEVSVHADIAAAPERVWELLASIDAQRDWNSTLTAIEGAIAEGDTVKLKVAAAGDREFKLKVSQVTPARGMTWSDGMAPMFKGVRTFELQPEGDATRFVMTEVFTGIMLPMIAGSLPDFVPVFETYAADLKRAAEA